MKKNRYLMIALVLLVVYAFFQISVLSQENGDPAEAYPEENAPPQQSAAKINFDGMAPDIEKIIQRGHLIVAMFAIDIPIFYEVDEDVAYEVDENGLIVQGLKGFDVDFAKALAASLGVEARFDRGADSFDKLTEKLKNGEVDIIISTYSITPERTKYISFSDPYLETYLSIIVGKQQLVRNKIEYNPLEYMKTTPGVKIGVEGGTAYVSLAKMLFPKAEIVELYNNEDGYEQAYKQGCYKVKSGELFACFFGELQILEIFEKDPTLSLYTSVYTFTDLPDQFCVGVSRDTPQLLNFVNSYIRTNKMVTYSEIAEAFNAKYGGETK